MRLRVENLKTQVEADEIEADWLFEYLSFSSPTFRYYNGKRKFVDEKVRLYNRLNCTFPSGFAPMVETAAPQVGFTVDIIDIRQPPIQRDVSADLSWLRDYQLKAVQISAQKTRGILHMVTAAGKSEVAVGLGLAFPCRWLFVVHRSALMEQAAERFERRTGLPSGRVGEGHFQIERFTSATFQTLYANIKNHKKRSKDQKVNDVVNLVIGAEGVIVDECHCLPAQSFSKVISYMKNAYFRVGLSGTPMARDDRRSLIAVGALGPVIYRVRPETLISRGLLAKPDIKMIESRSFSAKPTYQGVYGEAIVRSSDRNKLIVEAAKASAKPALIFIKEIKHGRTLLGRLERAGIAAEFVYGNTVTPSRMASVKRLIRGDIEVLVCSVVFQEGIDIPELKSVIVAAAGKSVIATIQRIGRGMRMCADKSSKFEVWDFYDIGNRILERHAKGRQRAYEQEGHEVKVLRGVP